MLTGKVWRIASREVWRGSPSSQNKEKCRDAEKVIDKKELRGYNGVVSARVLEW